MSALESDALPVTPELIRWARMRAGFSPEDARRHFRKIAEWEEGTAHPSYVQLEQMAEKFKCPVAVFFFPAPPDLPQAESSFRTLLPEQLGELPRTVKGFIRKAQAMQINLGELIEGGTPARRLITRDVRFAIDTPIAQVASAIRTYLQVPLSKQQEWANADEALEKWRDVLANNGVFVFKDAFHTSGFFGFCLYDDEFPVIYVNNSSAKTRQIFTLFHELGHLLFHTSGIDIEDDSYLERLPDDWRRIEIFCNKVAAEFLLPEGEFDLAVKGMRPTRDTAALLADRFKVSREVVYRKMLDRGWIDTGEYHAAAKAWAAQTKDKSGGDYYYTQIAYLGRRYIDLAFQRFHQRRFDERQLSEYLNIKPKYLSTFEVKYAGG